MHKKTSGVSRDEDLGPKARGAVLRGEKRQDENGEKARMVVTPWTRRKELPVQKGKTLVIHWKRTRRGDTPVQKDDLQRRGEENRVARWEREGKLTFFHTTRD